MANDRDSFIFYRSFYNSLSNLNEDTQMRFLKSIFRYVFFNVIPEFEDVEKAFWEAIKDTLDRDEKKWEAIRLARSEAGKKGGAPKGNKNANKQNKQMLDKTSNSLKKQAKQTKQAVDVDVNVNVDEYEYVDVNVVDDDVNNNNTSSSSGERSQYAKECLFLIHRPLDVMESFCKANGLTCINAYRAWVAVFIEFCKGEERTHQSEADLIDHFNKWFHKLGIPQPREKQERHKYYLRYYAGIFPDGSQIIPDVADSSKFISKYPTHQEIRKMEKEQREQEAAEMLQKMLAGCHGDGASIPQDNGDDMPF